MYINKDSIPYKSRRRVPTYKVSLLFGFISMRFDIPTRLGDESLLTKYPYCLGLYYGGPLTLVSLLFGFILWGSPNPSILIVWVYIMGVL